MAIKYYNKTKTNRTIAVLNNTCDDCINKIFKEMGNFPIVSMDCTRYKMPNQFKASVACHGDDVYNEDTGRSLAKKKLMDKYHKNFDYHYNLFLNDLTNMYQKIIMDDNNR